MAGVRIRHLLEDEKELPVTIPGTKTTFTVWYRPLAISREEQRQASRKGRELIKEASRIEADLKDKDGKSLPEHQIPAQVEDQLETLYDRLDESSDELFVKIVSRWELEDDDGQMLPITLQTLQADARFHPAIKQAIWDAIRQDRLPNSTSGSPSAEPSSETPPGREKSLTGTS